MTFGPFETVGDVRMHRRAAPVSPADELMLACAEAGVQLGRFDRRVLDELVENDVDTVWVVASIIRRAGRRAR